MPDEKERLNLQRTQAWSRNWTDDVDRLVEACYAADCVVTNMLSGYRTHGREDLRRAEHAMRSSDGAGRMEITRMIASGDKVAVQMDITRQDRRSRTCTFLTYDENGLIVIDNWYGQGAAGRSRRVV